MRGRPAKGSNGSWSPGEVPCIRESTDSPSGGANSAWYDVGDLRLTLTNKDDGPPGDKGQPLQGDGQDQDVVRQGQRGEEARR